MTNYWKSLFNYDENFNNYVNIDFVYRIKVNILKYMFIHTLTWILLLALEHSIECSMPLQDRRFWTCALNEPANWRGWRDRKRPHFDRLRRNTVVQSSGNIDCLEKVSYLGFYNQKRNEKKNKKSESTEG